MSTETSVVVALREVRRLEVERQRREEETRARQQEERALEEVRRRSMQHPQARNSQGWPVQPDQGGWAGHPDAQGPYNGHVRRTSEVMSVGPNGHGHAHAPLGNGWAPAAIPDGIPQPRQRGSGLAVFFTFVLCAGAAGAGYWKLDQDFRAQLGTLEKERRRGDDAHGSAIETRVKAEQDLKLRILELEAKLAKETARASAAEKAAAEAAAGVEGATADAARTAAATPAKPAAKGAAARPAAGAKGKKALAQVARPAAKAAKPVEKAEAAAPEEKAFVVPNFKKKRLSDDPLGGLLVPSKSM